MLYEIRLKGREKQGECSLILSMCFMVICLTVVSVNLLPLVYLSALKPALSQLSHEKAVALAVSSVLFSVLSVCYTCLTYGCDRFMLKRAENITAGAGDIFYYFKPIRMIKLSFFTLKFSTLKLLILTVLSLPCFICAYVFYTLCSRGFSAMVCSIFALFTGVLLLLSLGTYSKINNTLFLVRYRYIKGEYINFSHLLSLSQQEMQGKTEKLKALKWSFAGWFLLSFLIITAPYVWCYYRQTLACFAKEA